MSNANLITATQKTLERLEEKLTDASDVARGAQTAWTEAEAAKATIEEEVQQVTAALAALNGETISAKPTEAPTPPPADDPTQMSGEEFEKEIERKRRQRKKEQAESGPYAGIQCNACGDIGSLFDGHTNVKGKPVKVISCTGCSSIIMQ